MAIARRAYAEKWALNPECDHSRRMTDWRARDRFKPVFCCICGWLVYWRDTERSSR